jgi:hypothetical protein
VYFLPVSVLDVGPIFNLISDFGLRSVPQSVVLNRFGSGLRNCVLRNPKSATHNLPLDLGCGAVCSAIRNPQSKIYFTLLTSLKIGVMIEIAMKPTTTPRKMISIGSIIEVRPLTVASTSWS